MLKAQLEVENMELADKVNELLMALDQCNSGEKVGAAEHIRVLKEQLKIWQQRVYDLERVLEKIALPEFVARCDMMGLSETDGIDIGIRAGDLRTAYNILSEEPTVELLDMMKRTAEEERDV